MYVPPPVSFFSSHLIFSYPPSPLLQDHGPIVSLPPHSIPKTNNPTNPPHSNATSPAIAATAAPNKLSSKRVAIIIGGVLGSVAFILLVILLLLLFKRRNLRKTNRRITFHRDMMVQHRRRAVVPLPLDIEGGRRSMGGAGLGVSPLPFQSHSAALPFPAAVGTTSTNPHANASTGSHANTIGQPIVPAYVPAHEGPTKRQVQLNKRVKQLEEMMHEIRFRPGMSRVLEQLRVQVAWLRQQRNSAWALGETDVPPPHYEVYLL